VNLYAGLAPDQSNDYGVGVLMRLLPAYHAALSCRDVEDEDLFFDETAAGKKLARRHKQFSKEHHLVRAIEHEHWLSGMRIDIANGGSTC